MKKLLMWIVVLIVSFSNMQLGKSTPDPSKSNKAMFVFQRFNVVVQNDLGGSNTMKTHCFSGDDDLGVPYLKPGEKKNWSFRVNFFETTLFHCRLEWGRWYKELDVFSADDIPFVQTYCADHNCIWSARQNGIYLLKTSTHHFDRVQGWDWIH